MKFGLVSGTKDRFTLGAFFFSGLPNLFVHLNFQREQPQNSPKPSPEQDPESSIFKVRKKKSWNPYNIASQNARNSWPNSNMLIVFSHSGPYKNVPKKTAQKCCFSPF